MLLERSRRLKGIKHFQTVSVLFVLTLCLVGSDLGEDGKKKGEN